MTSEAKTHGAVTIIVTYISDRSTSHHIEFKSDASRMACLRLFGYPARAEWISFDNGDVTVCINMATVENITLFWD